jgi:hypothetical protein
MAEMLSSVSTDPVPGASDDDESPVAFGVDLRLTRTEDGGRRIPILFDVPYRYRPNWGLPSWRSGEQTGAPVLCASVAEAEPGLSVRVVIIPMFPSFWRDVQVGDELRMYEGLRLCGLGAVLWAEPTRMPLPEQDEARFCSSVHEGAGGSRGAARSDSDQTPKRQIRGLAD